MSNGNSVTICGSLGRDPELRFTPSGQAVTTFGVAVSRRWQDKTTQEWKEETDWIDVVCWGQLAENVAESIVKGTRVVVTGRFQTRKWETSEGDKRSKTEVVADEIGPSLRWATATVAKNERSDRGYDTTGSTSAASRPTPNAPTPSGYDYDEEPFVVGVHDWLPGAWGRYPDRML